MKPGLGLKCEKCSHIAIENSNFTNLISTENNGAAIHISDLKSSDNLNSIISYIENSRFESNKAMRGGAIYLDKP